MYPTRHNSEVTAVFFVASPPLADDRHDLGQQKRLLADAFADQGWEVPHMPWRGLVAGGVQKAANAVILKDYRPDASAVHAPARCGAGGRRP
jgi:hypothetical protein